MDQRISDRGSRLGSTRSGFSTVAQAACPGGMSACWAWVETGDCDRLWPGALVVCGLLQCLGEMRAHLMGKQSRWIVARAIQYVQPVAGLQRLTSLSFVAWAIDLLTLEHG